MNQAEIREKLLERFPGESLTVEEFRDQIAVTAAVEILREALVFLRDNEDLAFDYLSFVAGVDRYPSEPRFEVVYQLYSFAHNHRFRIKVQLEDIPGGKPSVESVTDLWPTAEWHERETAEMFGLEFVNHPDPRNLLLPDYWDVHPLRKDFPIEGNENTPDLPEGQEGNI
jgi:NADH-quinone oxidoreductase subunit C